MPNVEGTVQKIFTSEGTFKSGPNKGKSWKRWGFKLNENLTIGTFDAKAGGVVVEGQTYEFEYELDESGRANLVKGTIPCLVPTPVPTETNHNKDDAIRHAVAMKAARRYVAQRLQPVSVSELAESLEEEMKLVGRVYDYIDARLVWNQIGEPEGDTHDLPF